MDSRCLRFGRGKGSYLSRNRSIGGSAEQGTTNTGVLGCAQDDGMKKMSSFRMAALRTDVHSGWRREENEIVQDGGIRKRKSFEMTA